jgi:hypothetical protein
MKITKTFQGGGGKGHRALSQIMVPAAPAGRDRLRRPIAPDAAIAPPASRKARVSCPRPRANTGIVSFAMDRRGRSVPGGYRGKGDLRQGTVYAWTSRPLIFSRIPRMTPRVSTISFACSATMP